MTSFARSTTFGRSVQRFYERSSSQRQVVLPPVVALKLNKSVGTKNIQKGKRGIRTLGNR